MFIQPVLTREACDIISTEYTKLRAQENFGSDRAKVKQLPFLWQHSLHILIHLQMGKDLIPRPISPGLSPQAYLPRPISPSCSTQAYLPRLLSLAVPRLISPGFYHLHSPDLSPQAYLPRLLSLAVPRPISPGFYHLHSPGSKLASFPDKPGNEASYAHVFLILRNLSSLDSASDSKNIRDSDSPLHCTCQGSYEQTG